MLFVILICCLKANQIQVLILVCSCEVYFALPFNPAGEGQDYRKIHSIPYSIFDMSSEPVLIGAAFWNKVGQDNNTYNQLLEIFAKNYKRLLGAIIGIIFYFSFINVWLLVLSVCILNHKKIHT